MIRREPVSARVRDIHTQVPLPSRDCPMPGDEQDRGRGASSVTSRRALAGKPIALGAQFRISNPSTPAATN